MMTGWANIDCFFWCFRGRVENVMAYKIMKGIDRVDSQRFFFPEWKCQLPESIASR